MNEKNPLKSDLGAAILRTLTHFAEKVKGLEGLNDLYRQCAPGGEAGFFGRVLGALDLNIQGPAKPESVPATGALIIMAAFPASPLDSLALLASLERLRSDVKVLAPKELGWVPEARGRMIPLNSFRRGLGKNLSAIRAALAHLRQGGALVLFPWPAGFPALQRGASGGTWARVAPMLLRLSGAPVLPALVMGRGAEGRLEDPSMGARNLSLELGQVLKPERLAGFDEDKGLLDYLKLRAWLLRERCRRPRPAKAARQDYSQRPIASPVSGLLLAEELGHLAHGQKLAVAGDMEVWVAQAREIPLLMREIGRLRELTFRQAGEGTGKPLDLDDFDRHYLQLFIWRKSSREVVGAYRIGQTDKILKNFGPSGLYTQGLLRMKRPLLAQLNPALELGRSFVRAEYQKSYAPLLLLWKGIAAYVSKHPRYRVLFGAVSISDDYHPLSKELMVSYVKQHCYRNDLARLARPLKPYAPAYRTQELDPLTWSLGVDLDEISEWVSELEGGARGVPVLLRQYAKLGGSFIGFNVDPDFGSVVDGLIFVDLTQTDEKVLARTFGKDEAKAFLSWQKDASQPGAPV